MSRILQHDDEYTSRRQRRSTAKAPTRPANNPRIATVVRIAEALGTTVGDLLGERGFRFTRNDRRRLRDVLRYLTALFALDDPDLDEHER